jgi:hypothetical protein
MKTLSIKLIPTEQVSAETWLHYTKETFYLTTQGWSFENGDALCGVGPKGVCHCVARIGDSFHEIRSKNASIDRLLRMQGYKPVVVY